MSIDDNMQRLKQSGLMLPNYKNGSIANVPSTVAHLLGASIDGLAPLAETHWKPLGEGIERVVVLIIDGFGANLFHKMPQQLFDFDHEARVAEFITSVFPSTTVAALSSLWTGVGPNKHGLLGLKMFFPEFATAGQMLSLTPIFEKFPDALVKAGLNPNQFLRHDGFAEQLIRKKVDVHSYKGKAIVHSALSLMHGRGVTQEHGVHTFAEMMVNMRDLLENHSGKRLFINGYWPTVDTLSHSYTWKDKVVYTELSYLLTLIKEELVSKLNYAARKNTALFLVADHGQIHTPAKQQIYLEDHPELAKMLLMRPIGEPRVGYVFAKQGMDTAVVSYINQNLSHAFVALLAKDALRYELFGLGQEIDQARQRIGDVVIIAKDGYTLLIEKERDGVGKMIGRHGSLTHEEMLVPWLGYRLG